MGYGDAFSVVFDILGTSWSGRTWSWPLKASSGKQRGLVQLLILVASLEQNNTKTHLANPESVWDSSSRAKRSRSSRSRRSISCRRACASDLTEGPRTVDVCVE